MFVNVNGVNRDAVPYANVNGVWRKVTPYVNQDGTWRKTDKRVKRELDISKLTHFRVVYRPIKTMRYPEHHMIHYNENLDSVIDITGYDPDTINLMPKSLIYRFLEEDKVTEGIYCLKGIVYGVFDGESIPLSNIPNTLEAPDNFKLEFDTSYVTESNGPYVMGWNVLFSRKMNIPLMYGRSVHDTEDWFDPFATARVYKNGLYLYEEVDPEFVIPEMRINYENGTLMMADANDRPCRDMKRCEYDVRHGDLILTIDVLSYGEMDEYGYYKNLINNARQVVLPANDRSIDFDIVALIGIARDMKNRRHNMVGTHGAFTHNWNAIFVNGEPYPFSLEYIKEVG